MGIDVIEAGFPIASTGDFRGGQEAIAKAIKRSGDLRPLPRDIPATSTAAGEAIRAAERVGASTPSSPPAPCT
jgi:isopropylmalate/homocitrate/citramalate synthase